jgi:FtsP/CotA-like multicopper oxidase with cupredoxin domain
MTDPQIDDTTRLENLERAVERNRVSRDGWTLTMFGLAAIALLASVLAIGLGIRAVDESKTDVAAGDGGGEQAGGAAVEADLSEFAIDLSSDQLATGGTLTVRNNGTVAHNLTVRDADVATPDLQAGETATLDMSSLEAGTYEVYCAIPGHADSGMTAQLTIGDAGGGEQAAGGDQGDHGDHAMTPEEGAAQDQAMVDSIMQFPAETEGRGNQPLLPEVLADGTKHFELTASIVDWEVRPGETVQAWAYNGTVPGPRIDLDVGDHAEIQITNDLPIGTDIHWHGIDVPNDQDGVSPITQDLIASGDTYTYSFTVTEPAIGMYHAHAHADEAVPNGLFGTFYVGDLPLPAGRTISGIPIPADVKVAQDIPMVLNDAGVIGLSLDGKSFPATAPVVANVGDWVRVTYFNEGLQIHPMHLHGFEQIVIAKDGEPLDNPYAADTVLVAPGERYTVLFNASAPGTWVWHCHILNHVESTDGMFGMVTAVVVQ